MTDRCAARRAASPLARVTPSPGIARALGRLLVITLLCLLAAAGEARADGLLRFVVRDQNTGNPLPGVSVFLDDPTESEFRKTFVTGEDGTVTTTPLSAHPWQVTIIKVGYEKAIQEVTVVDEQTADVAVVLRLLPPTLIELIENRLLINKRDTANTTRRRQEFFQRYPVGVGNRQSIAKLLRSAPGFVENSLNQTHVRGEQQGIAINLNGFLLPSMPQGRLGQTLLPSVATEFDIKHGGLSPEFGGETGAILNLVPRSGTRTPILEGMVSDANFDTGEAYLSFGRRLDLRGAQPDEDGVIRKTFSYFVTGSQRYTKLGSNPPQDYRQTVNAGGYSNAIYGKFDLGITNTTTLTGIFNFADATTGQGDRLGLGDAYRDIGQGFGFLGRLNADAGLVNQGQLQQDVFQKDNNRLYLLQVANRLGLGSNLNLSVGLSSNTQRLQNNSPNGDVRDIPTDSSVEFHPDVTSEYEQLQGQLDYTLTKGDHTFKVGGLYNQYDAKEAFRFTPASQLALNALATLDPRLAPPGQFTGTGDPLGNREYFVDRTGAPVPVPTLRVNRDGYYGAFYVQDTWRLNDPFTVNAGFRYDMFRMSGDTGQEGYTESEFSPRLNISYLLPNRGPLRFLGSTPTILRASYNRLFMRPALGQGSFLGESVRPETADQWEASLERQFDLNQTVKVAFYTKDIENFLETQSLFPGTQLGSGAQILFNAGDATANGLEITYNYEPRDGQPFGGYLVYSNSSVKLKSLAPLNSLGQRPASRTLDHDQMHTLSGGVSYLMQDGTTLGLNLYYGSGLFSSGTPNGGRDEIIELNLRAATGPRFFNKAIGLEFAVENLLDSTSRFNFRSPYEGTRFQMGRRITISAFGKL
ncbi:MAG TPA: TonB-dependent receptor [Armatimonadaceae bacterium]|nr:TonB-dependent receptor [Armatimonadaceae bacterium]